MSSFVVTPESLQALQACVLGLAAELDNGPGATAGMQSAYHLAANTWGVAGDSYDIAGGQLNGLDQALDSFFAAWQNSLGQIGGNMERVATALSTAAERYAEVDDHVCLANP